MQVIKGMEDELATRQMNLLVKVVASPAEEIATHRRWQADRHVVGVIVADLVPDDPRLDALRDGGLPTVVMAQRAFAPGFATISTDNKATMIEAVEYLVGKGHRSIGRISGPQSFLHSRLRSEAFTAAGAAHDVETHIVEGDYTAERGAAATADLLELAEHPTAIIYDNDVMALSGLETVTGRGFRVPEDVAILAWDDSVHCQLATPPVSAIAHDVVAYGRAIALVLLDVLDGVPDASAEATPPRIVERASTMFVRESAGSPTR